MSKHVKASGVGSSLAVGTLATQLYVICGMMPCLSVAKDKLRMGDRVCQTLMLCCRPRRACWGGGFNYVQASLVAYNPVHRTCTPL